MGAKSAPQSLAEVVADLRAQNDRQEVVLRRLEERAARPPSSPFLRVATILKGGA